MLKRIEVFIVAVVFILITAIVVIIYTMQREHEFTSHNHDIQKSAVQGAAYAINLQLLNKHRHVRLFLDEYSSLIFRLNNFPNDEKTASDIKKRLQQRFPDFFTYTLTNQNGLPVLQNIDSLVGDTCQVDLSNFVTQALQTNNRKIQNKVFIHPQPFHYHYDIMAPLYTTSGVRVFFTSFYVNEIADILKTHEIPGGSLLLVKKSDNGLIEISKEGARDKLSRDIHLTEDEKNQLSVVEDIPNTDWRLVNLPNTDFEKQYLHSLWTEAIIIILIVAFALLLLIVMLIKLSDRRCLRYSSDK